VSSVRKFASAALLSLFGLTTLAALALSAGADWMGT
jgi:hypothetical protein